MTDFLRASWQAAQQGDRFAAYRLLVSAVEECPEDAEAWYRLGCVCHDLKKYPAATAAFSRAAAILPGDHKALTNLGLNLGLLGRYDEALAALDQAVKSDPAGALEWLHRSQVLHTVGDDGCVESARRAVALAPELPLAHMALAFCLLGGGNWLEGFREYEWRFQYKLPEFLKYPYPLWRGELTGTLLVQAEQGLGDALQMMRWIPAAAERAERLVWLVHKELYVLASAFAPGRVEVRAMPCAIPSADAFCPMMSLPVGLDVEDIDWAPYVKVTSPTVLCPELQVGIAWAGSPEHELAPFRDMPLTSLLRLAEVPGVALHSLQVGSRRSDIDEEGCHALLRDRSGEISDLADTARIIAGLDLVICVDTAVAHLAGAMGKEVWLLVNRRARDWRWLRMDRPTTAWYGSIRIMMRSLSEGWDDLVLRVSQRLKEKVDG